MGPGTPSLLPTPPVTLDHSGGLLVLICSVRIMPASQGTCREISWVRPWALCLGCLKVPIQD